MKKDTISDGLMKMPWADLAGILVTKDDLREAGWSGSRKGVRPLLVIG